MAHRLMLFIVLLSTVPAAAQDREVEAGFMSLTLEGRALSPVVEVWTLQEPAVDPAPAADDEEPAASKFFAARHPIWTGAIFGAAGGCVYGAAVGSTTSDITAGGSCAANAIAFSGIIAGTVWFARWYRDAAP